MKKSRGLKPIGDIAVELVRQCPKCRRPVQETAIVDAFNDPEGWAFWGPGHPRYIVCQGDGFVHFRVEARGKNQHRLAIIKPGYAPQPRPADAPPMVAGRRDDLEDW